jgi:hypothetical protein
VSEEAARFGGLRRAPDGQWICLFRSNMFGPSYVFAVEVTKAAGGSKTTE